ncbi:MAG: oligopeptide/dipeptide ABC transporter ATP-binding protein [Candidatus Bathyarchaeia archaeon]
MSRARRSHVKGEVPSAIKIPTGCRFHPRCPFTKNICTKEEPELRIVTANHFVACHLAKDDN